jgi:LysR family glycine cleavage system transcriptional activator
MIIATHLRSLQAVELALRAGSLKGAAEILAITPAAVGQRIKMLEDYLGFDLLTRGRSGLAPTPALAEALPHLQRAFQELGVVSEALDFQRINEIQIAAPTDWVELWLAPRLPSFRSQNPNIHFCINGEGDARLRVGRTDMEVAFALPQKALDATELILFGDFLIPIGSPENAARVTRAGGKNRLEGFPLLHLDFYRDDPAAVGWSEWIAAHGHRKSAVGFGIRFQRIAPGIQAVLSDAGLMICGMALILDRLKAGELVLPFPATTGSWTSHAFIARFRREALLRPQVRRFHAWLEREAEATRAEMETLVERRLRKSRRS